MGKSIIDITLSNYSLANKISDWKVENHLEVSDHFIITFTINDCINFRAAETSDWNYKKGDWSLFQSTFDFGLRNWSGARIWSITIESNLDTFLTQLNKALELSCPKKRSKHKYKYPTWWDDNLTLLRSKLRKNIRLGTPEGRTNYISLRREYKKSIKNAKHDGWKEFTSNIKYPSEVSKLIKSFNNSNNNALGLLKNKEGVYCNDPVELLSILLNKLFPGHSVVPKNYTINLLSVKNSRLDTTFTIKKVKGAFRSMGSMKSAGPDSLNPIVLKHFGPVAISCITKLFQAIYSTGYTPRQWRKSRVVFIPKPLKIDYGDVGYFRPISLTQFVFKTMEIIVEWSLREHADNFGTISPMQHAYSGSKGTNKALSTLVNMIESSILRGEFCLVVSVDIKGAFDNLSNMAIKNALRAANYHD